MDDIDEARVIRDAVLATDDDVEWGSTVFGSAEHQCWHVRGTGWRATSSTLWDVMNALGRGGDGDPDLRFELSQQSILEVFTEEDDVRILGMSFGSEASEDLVFAYCAERCAVIFRRELVAAQIELDRRSRKSTIVYGTAHAA